MSVAPDDTRSVTSACDKHGQPSEGGNLVAGGKRPPSAWPAADEASWHTVHIQHTISNGAAAKCNELDVDMLSGCCCFTNPKSAQGCDQTGL